MIFVCLGSTGRRKRKGRRGKVVKAVVGLLYRSAERKIKDGKDDGISLLYFSCSSTDVRTHGFLFRIAFLATTHCNCKNRPRFHFSFHFILGLG